jgi:hypothetical protein
MTITNLNSNKGAVSINDCGANKQIVTINGMIHEIDNDTLGKSGFWKGLGITTITETEGSFENKLQATIMQSVVDANVDGLELGARVQFVLVDDNRVEELIKTEVAKMNPELNENQVAIEGRKILFGLIDNLQQHFVEELKKAA